MAKETNPPVQEDEWEELSTGMGEEWDFDKRGDLIATILGPKMIDLPEHSQRDGRTQAGVWEFLTGDGEQVFLWDSFQLTEALTEVGAGDVVRIRFTGIRSFTGSDGPRQVKTYKVARKKG